MSALKQIFVDVLNDHISNFKAGGIKVNTATPSETHNCLTFLKELARMPTLAVEQMDSPLIDLSVAAALAKAGAA